MWVEYASVVEDGSLNGLVCHESISECPDNVVYDILTMSAGRGHPKHGGDKGVGVAGEDVYGHTGQSIYVADGHGRDGLSAAVKAAAVVGRLEEAVSAKKLLLSPNKQACELRSILVEHMRRSEFQNSGATFTQMILISSGGRRWAVTVNIGDSEALLVYRHKVVVCSVAHVWENQLMYQRYVLHSRVVKPVCYNRWNASDYQVCDPCGGHRPILLYDVDASRRVTVNESNVEWVSGLWQRRDRPDIEFGTQSVRMHASRHENWGSCVMVGGRARGQVMSTYGDLEQRRLTGMPFEMVHVYVHEIPCNEDVLALVQSDGVSNSRSIHSCGLMAWCQRNADQYLDTVEDPRDDLSVGMAYFQTVGR